jgi:hypothetical protein
VLCGKAPVERAFGIFMLFQVASLRRSRATRKHGSSCSVDADATVL